MEFIAAVTRFPNKVHDIVNHYAPHTRIRCTLHPNGSVFHAVAIQVPIRTIFASEIQRRPVTVANTLRVTGTTGPHTPRVTTDPLDGVVDEP